MKLNKIIVEGSEIKPWKFEKDTITMDNKGKIQFLHPELRGPAQCPFWKALKTKIAANLKEGMDDVKVPKSFAIEVGKEYKVPLDPTYTTPMCIGAKICAHFKGVGKGAINCDFKIGVKAGPEKKVDVASTKEPVPQANKAEAPVKEEVKEEKYTGSVGNLGPMDEANKCPKCGKPQKENTEGNPKYCQGHSPFDEKNERVSKTSATPLVGLTDPRPINYPQETMGEKKTEWNTSSYKEAKNIVREKMKSLAPEVKQKVKELAGDIYYRGLSKGKYEAIGRYLGIKNPDIDVVTTILGVSQYRDSDWRERAQNEGDNK